MKLGLEVEGRLLGLPTLFMQASELLEISANPELLQTYKVQGEDSIEKDIQSAIASTLHVYVSDHENRLSPNDLCEAASAFGGRFFTVEVSRAPENRTDYPSNVTFMLKINNDTGFWNLTAADQVKWTSPENNVLAASLLGMVFTENEDFAGDIVLEQHKEQQQ